MRLTLADKAYYVAEYLKELQDIDALPPRTVCEKYEHVRAGEMGLLIKPDAVLIWADEIITALSKRKSKLKKV